MSTKSIIIRVESQVEQLVADHKRLSDVCRSLKAERDRLLEERRELQQQVKDYHHQLSVLQLREGLGSSMSGVEMADVEQQRGRARARVNQLMREVDRCINLLSATEAE